MGRNCFGHSAYHSYFVTHKYSIGFCQKEMPEPYTTNIALYFIFNAIDNDNNALACLFIKTAIISPAVF